MHVSIIFTDMHLQTYREELQIFLGMLRRWNTSRWWMQLSQVRLWHRERLQMRTATRTVGRIKIWNCSHKRKKFHIYSTGILGWFIFSLQEFNSSLKADDPLVWDEVHSKPITNTAQNLKDSRDSNNCRGDVAVIMDKSLGKIVNGANFNSETLIYY